MASEDPGGSGGPFRQDPRQVQEWLRQNNLIYGGLIAIGVAMVQPFLTAVSLDLSARICVVAFSVAIPLLAALVVINRQESVLRRPTMAVHSAGDARLERDQGPTPPAADGPGEAGA